MSLNSHDYNERQTISLEDLAKNGKEKLVNLSDEELQQLKQQAVDAEEYDIAKMIKQEQAEREEKLKADIEELQALLAEREGGWGHVKWEKAEKKEELQESDDSQELDWQAKREEAWKDVHKKIREENDASRKENLEKAEDLKNQLNDWEESKNEKENKLNEISDDEILIVAETIHLISEWRWRENSHMLKKLSDYPTEENIPWMRKYMEEHPENGITDKESFYKMSIDEILELVKASERNFNGTLIWNTDSLEGIIKWINLMEDYMKNAWMEETEQFWKLKNINEYFSNQIEAINNHLNHRIDSPISYRRRRH